ncbi:hypothetical protein C8R44DRAFT_384209 [Mycena epipterygia]|nr:hypothetical protein C8R44DRAFT_384209 [Mycena epipterygia]
MVDWIIDILKAFQQADGGLSTTRSWNNLDSVRVLVNEICQWANDRLKDGWWSSLKKKLNKDQEKGIQEFQSQLEKATSSFMQLSMINLSQAHDEEIQKIDKILEQIQDLSGYAQEKRLEEQYQVDLTFIQQELAPYIAANSGYREQKKKFCYSGTRGEPLAEIKIWLSREAPHFLWLTGEPGAGKSTIAATVCRDLKDSNCLWAQLFINRNDEDTTNPKFFFPSIALQLAKRSPEVAHAIYLALQEKPSLVDEVNETLAEQLFIEPLKCAVNPLQPIVVVVDALDEAKEFNILVKILSKMTTRLPAKTKVLISSRGEDTIRASWATAQDTKHLSVGVDQNSSIVDVDLFLEQRIKEIAREHDLDGWPGKEATQKLCLQASGLFIWAVTAVTHIKSQIEATGKEYLDDLLDQLNREGMSDINKLYHVILDNIYHDQTNPWLFETFRRVVGAIVVLSTPLSVGALEKVLDLRRVDVYNPSKIHPRVDMLHFFRLRRTVLMTGTEEITQETIPRLHKSFFEFIISENVRSDLRVSVLLSHRELAPKCLAHSTNVGDPYFQAARSSYQWLFENLLDEDPDITACLLHSGDLEYSNYQDCDEVASLDTSVSAVTRLIKLTPDQHHEKPRYLSKLCILYCSRYQRLGDLKDLDYALQNMRVAVSLTPEGYPDQPHHLQILAASVRESYTLLRNLHDLGEPLSIIQEAADLTLDRHPDGQFDAFRDLETALQTIQVAVTEGHLDRSQNLYSQGVCFKERYRRLRALQDLETAMQFLQEAVALTPEGHPDRAGRLQSLAMSFVDRYRQLGDLNDLEAALQRDQEAVDLTPEGHQNRSGHLQNLAMSFVDRYRQLGDLNDLEAALQRDQEAMYLTLEGHPDRAGHLQSLAVSFADRYRRLGDLNDLEAALQLGQQTVDLTPEGHPDRAGHLQSLAVSFADRYRRLGDLNDLEAALQRDQEALDLTPDGHPDRAHRLQSLAVSFKDRYQRLGDLDDLEAALQRNQEAVDLTPDGHPDRAHRLQSLAVSFKDRYQRLGDLDDLEAALQLGQQTVDLTPEGHPDRAGRLQSLAVSFTDRYRRLGNLNDLEAALQRAQEAVNLTPDGRPDRARRLQSLAVSFKDRYQRLGDLDDLEAALQRNQEALDLTPDGHPDRARRLQSLAVSFKDRYQRLGDLDDLEAALQRNQEAVDLTPDGHPDRARCLQSLAVSFKDRYQRLGDLDDLEAALQRNQEAVDLTPDGHPDRAHRLQSLAVSFKDRYQRLGDLDDREAALQLGQQTVDLTPEGHPDMV